MNRNVLAFIVLAGYAGLCLFGPLGADGEITNEHLDLPDERLVCLRWAGIGGRTCLLYVQGRRLCVWPLGKTLALPKPVAGISEFEEPNPHQLVLKLRPGEPLGAILNRATGHGLLVDLMRMSVIRRLTSVRDVGWCGRYLCLVKKDDYQLFGPLPTARWFVGGKMIVGPRGFIVTAISEDAKVMLARVAEKDGEGKTCITGAAVLKLCSGASGVEWVTRLFSMTESEEDAEIIDISGSEGSDFISWNEARQAAAIVLGRDTAGGWELASLHVAEKGRVLMGLESIGATGVVTSIAAPPKWVQDKLIVSIEDRDLRPPKYAWIEQKLILLDPFKQKADIIQHTMIWPILGDINDQHGVIAYAMRNPYVYYVLGPRDGRLMRKRWFIVIERYALPCER